VTSRKVRAYLIMSFIMCSHVLSLLTARHRPHSPRYANPCHVDHSNGPGFSRRRQGRMRAGWRATHERTHAFVFFLSFSSTSNPDPTRRVHANERDNGDLSPKSQSPRFTTIPRGCVRAVAAQVRCPRRSLSCTYLLILMILSYLTFRPVYHSRSR
jgi:hypothetical protein